MQRCVIAAAFALCVGVCTSASCSTPPPASNFELDKAFGVWYEIGRIQTPGGALIQDFCACTSLIYTPTDATNDGNATVLNSCRFLSPDGFYLNATSTLTDMAPPGHWSETFYPGGQPASYNFILMGTDAATGIDYAVEYDCSDSALFGINYWYVQKLSTYYFSLK